VLDKVFDDEPNVLDSSLVCRSYQPELIRPPFPVVFRCRAVEITGINKVYLRPQQLSMLVIHRVDHDTRCAPLSLRLLFVSGFTNNGPLFVSGITYNGRGFVRRLMFLDPFQVSLVQSQNSCASVGGSLYFMHNVPRYQALDISGRLYTVTADHFGQRPDVQSRFCQ